jgi:hypothetical protein
MSVTNLNSLVQEMVDDLIKKILRSPNFDYSRDLYDIDALMPRGVSDLNAVFDNFQKIRSRLSPTGRRCVLNRMVNVYLETKKVPTKNEMENIILNCQNGAGSSKRSLSEAFDEEDKKEKEKDPADKPFRDKNIKEILAEMPECVICLESLTNGYPICMLEPCKHILHYDCSNKMKYDNCPICRTDIIRRFVIGPELLNFGKAKRKMGLREINKLISSVKNIK